MADDTPEECWTSLEESTSKKFGDFNRGDLTDFLKKFAVFLAFPRGEKIRELYEENGSRTLETEFENRGDDQ